MKICFFANSDFYLYNFRFNLLKELKKSNWEVFVCCPETKVFFKEEFKNAGIIFLPISIKRGMGSIFDNYKYFQQVKKICRTNRFDLCHNFTPKVGILGSWAQKKAGIKNIVCSVSGLGYVYASSKFIHKILRIILNKAYKIVFSFCKKVIFQNPDDLEFFLKKKIIIKRKAELIMGSGVDCNYFQKERADISEAEAIKRQLGLNGEILVVMISRLLWQKGVKEFVEASEKLRNSQIKFVLVGPIDKENPDFVPSKNISEWEEKGLIQYLGERKDIREVLFASDIFVLPSYYQEGVPKVLLEAASMEKPLVAADNVGIREVIEEGINGFLVRPKKSQDLSEAILKLAENPGLRQRFGQTGRQKILQQFSDEIVINKTREIYDSLISKS
jgi:N,N'-diacetylbacillosaminyl-diphospho-undecaprenol alpha-1,3-N-acetylgalactosaminyltransferase